MNEQEIRQLYERYLNGETDEAETHELKLTLADPANQELAEALLESSFEKESGNEALAEEKQQQILAYIFRKKTSRLWPRIAAAASVLLVLSIGAYFVVHHPKEQSTTQYTSDVKPGHNQATLTLADGRKIILTRGLRGQLARQGNVRISADTGAIAYIGNNETLQYNTLSTKRGEALSYPLVLADGTRVWLNAASSLNFPAAFKGKDREVTLIGEAYFEVVHNAKQPFRVKTQNQTIEDIGTSFDVNGYADEPQQATTLLEGAVRVNGHMLKPGQQIAGDRIKDVDTRTVVAWKNGQFRFDNERLGGIMRQAARWYNIDVSYDDPKLQDETFGGITTRFANISGLLHTLELTRQVRFSIEGRKISVHSY